MCIYFIFTTSNIVSPCLWHLYLSFSPILLLLFFQWINLQGLDSPFEVRAVFLVNEALSTVESWFGVKNAPRQESNSLWKVLVPPSFWGGSVLVIGFYLVNRAVLFSYQISAILFCIFIRFTWLMFMMACVEIQVTREMFVSQTFNVM